MSDPTLIPPLPESFMFGVATADHQCEAYDPEFEDIRDVWERRRAFTLRGNATDFWNRYPEDIELARNLGCKAFRFSIAWSRVEPHPDQFNQAAFDHYRQVIATIRKAGMELYLAVTRRKSRGIDCAGFPYHLCALCHRSC
jgi:beta-glucosidase/6-phospho-beta-glucosidase/beta-galactosidase